MISCDNIYIYIYTHIKNVLFIFFFFFFFFFFLRGCSIILKDETLPFLILNIFLWRVTISNSDNFLSLIIVHIQSIIRLSITMHPSNFIIFL